MEQDASRCLWQYPIPHDQIEFRLAVPRGAAVLKLIKTETMLGEDFTLLMSVDPNEEQGEDVHFCLKLPGEVYPVEWAFVDGPLRLGLFLFMSTERTPHPHVTKAK